MQSLKNDTSAPTFAYHFITSIEAEAQQKTDSALIMPPKAYTQDYLMRAIGELGPRQGIAIGIALLEDLVFNFAMDVKRLRRPIESKMRRKALDAAREAADDSWGDFRDIKDIISTAPSDLVFQAMVPQVILSLEKLIVGWQRAIGGCNAAKSSRFWIGDESVDAIILQMATATERATAFIDMLRGRNVLLAD